MKINILIGGFIILLISIVNAELINLRIKFEYVNKSTLADYDDFNQQLEIAKMFISNLIKVNKPSDDTIKPQISDSCGGVSYPFPKVLGVQETDLYILVIIGDFDQDTDFQGSFCDTAKPPRFGYINVSKSIQITSNEGKYVLMQKLIRVLLRVVAFDKGFLDNLLIPDLNNLIKEGKVAGKQNGSQLLLKNVLKTAMEYFGCQDNLVIEGAPLENYSSSQIRWETTLLMEDIMSSTKIQIAPRLRFSIFNIALLNSFVDSGFYKEINQSMGEKMTYGKGKGCTFYQDGCSSSQQFSEFCVIGSKKCNIQQTQLSTCSFSEYSNSCSYYYGNEACGSSQLCFDQQDSTLNPQCLTSRLLYSADKSLEIELTDSINQTYSCKNNGQLINSQPKIKCPSDIQAYVEQLEQECPNYCSGNGYCNNGQCTCQYGYFGLDCAAKGTKDIKFSYGLGLASDNTIQNCPSGYSQLYSIKFKIGNDDLDFITCKCSFENNCAKCSRFECAQCKPEYVLSPTKKICLSCNSETGINNCEVCQLGIDGITVDKCLKCKTGYQLLKDGKCYENCPAKQYLDVTNQKCVDCLIGCEKCSELTHCFSCSTQHQFDIPFDSPFANRICYINCGEKKAAIKEYLNEQFNKCEDCTKGDGYENCNTCHFEKLVKKCDTCNNNFKVSQNDGKCSECMDQYFLKDKQCLKCGEAHCIQCESVNKCTLCEDGYYVLNGSCVTDCGLKYYANLNSKVCTPCIENCDICINSTECIVCGNRKYYNSENKLEGCTNSIDKYFCSSTCDLCTIPSEMVIPVIDYTDAMKKDHCFTCKNDSVLIPNYEPKDQKEKLKSNIYFGQCKQFCFENQMAFKQPKYETRSMICEYCDEDNLCKKCNKDGGCSECIDKNKYYLDQDTQKCVQWDQQCTKKDDKLGCLSCYNNQYQGYKQSCVKQCPSDYSSITDGENSYCQKVQCFHSCETCVGPDYQQCLTCPLTRKLQVFHGSFYGQCVCESKDYTDTYQNLCELSKEQLNYEISSYFFTATALAASGLTSFALMNPIPFFFLADHSQSIGQLTYVDKMNPYGLDRSMSGYKYFNLNILIPSPIVNQKLEQKRLLHSDEPQSHSGNRILQSAIDVKESRGIQNESKIVDYHNSKNYIYSGFWSFVILSIVWIIKGIGHILLGVHEKKATPGGVQVDTPKPSKWMNILEEYFIDLFPLGVFLLTCSELTLLSFIDFRFNQDYMQQSGGYEVVSVVFASLYLLFAAFYLLYLAFSPKEGIIYSLFDEYRAGSMFFYIFLALKKIGQSTVIAFLEGNQTSQAFSVLIIETVFIFYLIFVRPFKKETFFNMIYIGGEIIVFTVIIVYTILSYTLNNRQNQNNCAQAILILMMLLMVYHILSSLVLIVFFIFKCCRKKQRSSLRYVPSDSKLQTEARPIKHDSQTDQGLETIKGKTPQSNKNLTNQIIQEEQSNDNSANIPQIFQPSRIPVTQAQPEKSSNGSMKEENNFQKEVEQEEDYQINYDHKSEREYRQQMETQHAQNEILLEASDNISEFSNKKERIKNVPVFSQIKEGQHFNVPSKSEFEERGQDYSPRYMKSSQASQQSQSGVFSKKFQDDGFTDVYDKNQFTQSRNLQPYQEIQLTNNTPFQSNNNLAVQNQNRNIETPQKYQKSFDTEDNEGSQGFFTDQKLH